MDHQQYQKIRVLILLLVATIVATAIIVNNLYLAFAGVLIGMLFLLVAKQKFKQAIVDERVISIAGRASQVTYVVVTTLLACLGLFFTLSAKTHNSPYLESIGVVFCYVALLLVTIYSLSYHYFNKKYGADE
ncbi:MAG: DUF2178 domain-containing protein [Patescibacteria group bacterium]|jgi:uncharacterized membrane protein